jgi:hypothetical protein
MVLAPISVNESKPNSASATDRAGGNSEEDNGPHDLRQRDRLEHAPSEQQRVLDDRADDQDRYTAVNVLTSSR